MNHFCTLFDLKFISQGVSLYESLVECRADFHLYIFAFCEKSFEVLSRMGFAHATVIPLRDFEDEALLRVKPTRTKGEYCWTCAGSTILYCMRRFGLDRCTYLDADLFFYEDPCALLDEMGENSVLITEHRYTPEYDQTDISGRYCVQFVSFRNDKNGLRALNWWRDACLEWCYNCVEDGKFGDQKYLDDWTTRFNGVHVMRHLGGGVAPWNMHQYDIFHENGRMLLRYKKSKQLVPLIFYHFHSIKLDASNRVDCKAYNAYRVGWKVSRLLSRPYVARLIEVSKRLHALDGSIPVVLKPKIRISAVLKNVTRKIIRIKIGKGGYIKLFGFDII